MIRVRAAYANALPARRARTIRGAMVGLSTRTLARESKPSIYFDGLRAPALRLPLETANGEAAGPAAFFTCLGFFGSRPLRF